MGINPRRPKTYVNDFGPTGKSTIRVVTTVTTSQNTFSLAFRPVSAAFQQLGVFPERIAANAAANPYAPKNAGRPWRAHLPGGQDRSWWVFVHSGSTISCSHGTR